MLLVALGRVEEWARPLCRDGAREVGSKVEAGRAAAEPKLWTERGSMDAEKKRRGANPLPGSC